MTGKMGVSVIVVCSVLSACGASEHTVEWYSNHPEKAAKKAAECKNDAAKRVSSDCQNAIEGHAEYLLIGDGEGWDFPDISGGSNPNDQQDTKRE